MTWHRLVTVPTPEQARRRDREALADRDPGDHRLRGASRDHLERADRALVDLEQRHLSEFQGDGR